MSDKLDTVLQSIAELTDAVRQRGGTQEMDKEGLFSGFAKLLDEHKAALLEEIPQRRGEQSEATEKAAEGYKGKWDRQVKDIVAKGAAKLGNYQLRAVDFWMAKNLIDGANRLKEAGQGSTAWKELRPASNDLNNVVKLLTATTSGTGDEWVPTNMAGEIWQDMFVASRIASDLPQIPMPTDPFDIPQMGEATWRKGGEGAATSSSNNASSKSTLTSTELITEVDWSYNLDEDAVVALMPELRRNLSRSGGEMMDYFVINADSTATATGNINSDDGTPASDNYYLSAGQDGIRHLWIVDKATQANSGGGDALADADLTAGLNDLGKYGMDIQNVRIVPGIEAYFAMLGLTNVATVEKYGNAATIVSGELMRYRGIPVIPTPAMGLTESDYKQSVTSASNTLGAISIYNRNMWRVGFRRNLLLEVDRDIRTRQLIMVASFRIAVGTYGTRSSATHTSGIGNFTV